MGAKGTAKMMQMLDLIVDYQIKNRISPSFEELRKIMELKSKSGIARLADGLETRGYIRRHFGQKRNIEILPRGYAESTVKQPAPEGIDFNLTAEAADHFSTAALMAALAKRGLAVVPAQILQKAA